MPVDGTLAESLRHWEGKDVVSSLAIGVKSGLQAVVLKDDAIDRFDSEAHIKALTVEVSVPMPV